MICLYCLHKIQDGQVFILCPSCERAYHPHCWHWLGNRCAVPWCNGEGDFPVQIAGQPGFQKRFARYFSKVKQTSSNTNTTHSPIVRNPTTRLNWSDKVIGIFFGVIAWVVLGWITLAGIAPYIELPYLSLVYGGIALWGAWKGFQSTTIEWQRLIYILAGWLSLQAVGEIFAILLASEGIGEFTLLYISTEILPTLTGIAGAFLGAFVLASRRQLLFLGLGTSLGFYCVTIVQTLGADLSMQTEWGYLISVTILSFAVLLSLLWKFPAPEVFCALFTCLVTWLLFREALFLFIGNWPFFKLNIMIILIFIPFVGYFLAHSNPEQRLIHQRGDWEPSPRDIARLSMLGTLGVAEFFTTLSVIAGSALALAPLAERFIKFLVSLPFSQSILGEYLGEEVISADFTFQWIAIWAIYACIAILASVAKQGWIIFLYRALHFVFLVSLCASLAYLVEQGFEYILTNWTIYRLFGPYILWMGEWLPIGVIVIGFLFGWTCAKDQMPLLAKGVIFSFWFLQVALLSAILILVGGVAGTAMGAAYSWFSNPLEEAFWGMTMREAIVFAGIYLGFGIGVVIPIIQQLNGNQGANSAKLKERFETFSKLIDDKRQEVITLSAPLWQSVVYVFISISLTWLFWVVLIEELK